MARLRIKIDDEWQLVPGAEFEKSELEPFAEAMKFLEIEFLEEGERVKVPPKNVTREWVFDALRLTALNLAKSRSSAEAKKKSGEITMAQHRSQAIELLRSWRKGDRAEQIATWEAIAHVADGLGKGRQRRGGPSG